MFKALKPGCGGIFLPRDIALHFDIQRKIDPPSLKYGLFPVVFPLGKLQYSRMIYVSLNKKMSELPDFWLTVVVESTNLAFMRLLFTEGTDYSLTDVLLLKMRVNSLITT